MRPNRSLAAALVLVCTLLGSSAARAQTPAGTLFFNDIHDSIMVDGQTVVGTTATYEAWVYFPDALATGSYLFNEWTNFHEDKALAVTPTSLYGYNHATGAIELFIGESTIDEWHHVAFVTDTGAGKQSLYRDGQLMSSSAASGDINDDAGPAFIGSIYRDGFANSSFRGFIDSLRISDIARYSGESYTPPDRDMPTDANTLLLYQFDAEDFFVEDTLTKITDRSANGRTGTFGFGFQEATHPAAPANQGDVDCSGSLSASDALKVLRASVGSPNSQSEPCPDFGEVLTTGIFGDVDCNGSVAASDALKVLRVSVGLESEQEPGCVPFGEPV